jgi:hypothetical protein
VQFAQAHAIAGTFRLREIGFDGTQFCIAVDHELQRRPFQGRHLLLHLGHDPSRRDRDVAFVHVQRAEQQPEQARLAAAVGSDDPDLLTRIDGEAGALEQAPRTPLKGDATETYHREYIRKPTY